MNFEEEIEKAQKEISIKNSLLEELSKKTGEIEDEKDKINLEVKSLEEHIKKVNKSYDEFMRNKEKERKEDAKREVKPKLKEIFDKYGKDVDLIEEMQFLYALKNSNGDPKEAWIYKDYYKYCFHYTNLEDENIYFGGSGNDIYRATPPMYGTLEHISDEVGLDAESSAWNP